MKVLARLIVAGFVLAAVLTPLTVLADGLPAPLEKKIQPGVTTVTYAGQDLRFTTDVPLFIRCFMLDETRLFLAVRAYGVPSLPGGVPPASSPQNEFQIYWENWSSEVHSGPPPVGEDWEGILNTESGFTEK
jgi:hypothetical protein